MVINFYYVEITSFTHASFVFPEISAILIFQPISCFCFLIFEITYVLLDSARESKYEINIQEKKIL